MQLIRVNLHVNLRSGGQSVFGYEGHAATSRLAIFHPLRDDLAQVRMREVPALSGVHQTND